MTKAGQMAQANLSSEHRGNCLPPSHGCTPPCREANELMALTEPYMQPAARKPARLPPRMVVLKRPTRRVKRAVQPTLFDQEAS